MRTAERSTDAEREMMSQIEYHGGKADGKMPAEELRNTAAPMAGLMLAPRKAANTLHRDDGMNVRRWAGCTRRQRVKRVSVKGEKCFPLTSRA